MSEEQKHATPVAKTTESGPNFAAASTIPSNNMEARHDAEAVSAIHAGNDIKLSHVGGAGAIALAKAEFTKETVWKCKEAVNITAGSKMEVTDALVL